MTTPTRPPISSLLKRFWIVLVIVLALLMAGAVVGRLRTFFDSDRPYAGAPRTPDAIVPFHVKRITYEIVGPAGATGRVSYLDVHGNTQEASLTVPWSITVSTTDPGILANVVAQGDDSALGCRILVDNHVVAENYAQGPDTQTFCLDKAA